MKKSIIIPDEVDTLELTEIRRPFEDMDVIPIDVHQKREHSQRLIITAGTDDRDEYARQRVIMLRSIMQRYPRILAQARANIGTHIEDGLVPLDAIANAFYVALEESIAECADEDKEYSDAVQILETMMQLFGVEKVGAVEKFKLTTRHGIASYMAPLEVIPDLYERHTNEQITGEELEELVPNAAKYFYKELKRVTGGYANIAEQAMGMHNAYWQYGELNFKRYSLDPGALRLVRYNQELVLDAQPGIAAAVYESSRGLVADYHGCLADFVEVEQGQERGNAFEYFDNVIVEEMRKHWFKTVVKSS